MAGTRERSQKIDMKTQARIQMIFYFTEISNLLVFLGE